MKHMNGTRISSLCQELGWTQERLASESGVGIRTVQRLEAGHDASLERSPWSPEPFGVPVRDLFTALDGRAFTGRVESLEARTEVQQTARDRATTACQLLYAGVGFVVTLLAFTHGQVGFALIAAYWGGGLLILAALRTLVIEPRLDAVYPLSHRRPRTRRRPRRLQDPSQTEDSP